MKKLLLFLPILALLILDQPALNAKERRNKRNRRITIQQKKHLIKRARQKQIADQKRRQNKKKNTKTPEKPKKKQPQRPAPKPAQPQKTLTPQERKLFLEGCAEGEEACKNYGITKQVVFKESLLQTGSHCGYFSAYNSACMLAQLNGKPKPAFNLNLWAKAIVARRKMLKEDVHTPGLNMNEIEHVTKVLKITPQNLTFVSILGLQKIADDAKIKQIRNKINNNKPHAFIFTLLTMFGWHAVCAIATKKAYYFLDSNNSPFAYVYIINALDKRLNARPY